MATVRTKQVKMDGAEFTIAPLTLDQIEQYIAPLEDVATQKAIGFRKAYEVVCYGLNNALPEGTPEDQKWTKEKVSKQIDMVLFERLQEEIIEFSGFRLDKEAIDKAGRAAIGVPGESSAASAEGNSQPMATKDSPLSTSSPSVVA